MRIDATLPEQLVGRSGINCLVSIRPEKIHNSYCSLFRALVVNWFRSAELEVTVVKFI